MAATAVLAFGVLSWTRWIAISDFIFHWGLKAHRFYISASVDYPYLAKPWNWAIHPGYPNLLPELYAATAVLLGVWREAPLLVWSALLLALLLLAARQTLSSGGLPASVQQAILALIALALATFGIGHVIAGAADWLIALAFVAAIPALLRPADRAGDILVGLCAAFAAASKLEGLTLGAWLILTQLWRWPLHLRNWKKALGSAAAIGLPYLVVVIPWAAANHYYGLSRPFHPGFPNFERALLAAPNLLRASAAPAWLGLPASLLLLPFLVLNKRTRPAAIVIALQLTTYLWQYAATASDTALLVATSWPRLLLHLLPSTVLLAALAFFQASEHKH